MILTTIPFSGFYESIHNDNIDQAENLLFANNDGISNEGLQTRFFKECNYSQVFKKYAEAYADQFSEDFKIRSLKFVELNSPRQYNFSTDHIVCSISRADLRVIYKATDRQKLTDHVRENCTSRSGFMSFYDPDLKKWGYVDNWEQPQIKLLLDVYCDQETDAVDFNDYEVYCMDDYSGNGYFDDWLCEACPIVDRLYKIHNYLQTREGRK
jgi:hypothetical protein